MSFIAGSRPRSVTAGDLDGDGDLDLAVANGFNNDVSILLGDGAGGFAGLTSIAAGNNPVSVATGDFNADGDLDLVVANLLGDDVSVLLNEGALCLGDLDGDGMVGIVDFLALLAAWGTDPGGPPDFDGDGMVGIADFLTLLACWGPCP